MRRTIRSHCTTPRLTSARPKVCAVLLALAVAVFGGVASRAAGQDLSAASDELSIEQARLADRFERLEMVLGRLAELSAGTDPQRARLLREAIAKSREQNLDQRFETIVTLLEGERLSAASRRQTELHQELDELLSLLLKADRARELESMHRRIKQYLQEVGRLIRLQKGIKARTEGGDDATRLAKDQREVADQTGELGDTIGESEAQGAASAGENAAPTDESEAPSEKQSEAGDKPSDTDGQSQDSPPEGRKPQDGSSPPGSPNQGQSPSGDGGQPSDSDQSPPSPGDPSPSGGQTAGRPQPQQQPTDRAAERLRSAQQRMQQAQQQLEQAERDGAAREQREAIKALEQARAELERVLRQLREEEMERMLTQLAARFRKMLDAQLQVYDATVRLDRVPAAARDHDDEIEGGRLSREEKLIADEADRALLLLREEGSSVAFPETVSLMRDDMQQVARRLADLKVGEITQGLEEDIIESLEEMIAALEKAIQDLQKQRTPPGRSPPPGQPTKPPLVDQLAELKMIRALQMRINRRTERYGKMVEGEQAEAPELLEVLAKLAVRQQRVYQATYDLSRGRND